MKNAGQHGGEEEPGSSDANFSGTSDPDDSKSENQLREDSKTKRETCFSVKRGEVDMLLKGDETTRSEMCFA